METRERFNLSRIAIEHPRFTVAFWVALCVCGWFAFRSLNYALLPDITFPVVVVTATASAPQSATETARDLSLPIEQQLKSLQGLGSMRATIRPGLAVVTLSFGVGQDLERCAQRVTNALRTIKLPTGATAKATPLNLNQTSVATYTLAAPGKSLSDLETLVDDKIAPALKVVPGVGDVLVHGSS